MPFDYWTGTTWKLKIMIDISTMGLGDCSMLPKSMFISNIRLHVPSNKSLFSVHYRNISQIVAMYFQIDSSIVNKRKYFVI